MKYEKSKGKDIFKYKSGWVGTQKGMKGFLEKTSNQLQEGEYEYCPSTPLRTSLKNWISIYDFQQIYNWKTKGIPPVIRWNKKKLDGIILYKILLACSSQSLYIGVGSGLDALKKMKKELIASRTFQLLTADGPPNRNWVKGNDFRKVMEEKGF